MKLGERLRERRRQLRMTLKDVAEEAKISIPYLSDVERDKAQPPLDTLTRIASALETTTMALLDGVDGFGARDEISLLPLGLQELKEHPVFGAEITDDWLRTLARVDYRGKRPETMKDWLLLHQTLKTIYSDDSKAD